MNEINDQQNFIKDLKELELSIHSMHIELQNLMGTLYVIFSLLNPTT